MKLTYRGVSYDYDPNQRQINDLDAVGSYRGAAIRFLPTVPQRTRAVGLKYRGASYDESLS